MFKAFSLGTSGLRIYRSKYSSTGTVARTRARKKARVHQPAQDPFAQGSLLPRPNASR